MDRRTFVKASCVGSASLFLDGIDPKAFGEVTLPEPPPIEVVHGPKPAKSPLGMPGLFPGRVVEVTDSRLHCEQPGFAACGPRHDRARDEGIDRRAVSVRGLGQIS